MKIRPRYHLFSVRTSGGSHELASMSSGWRLITPGIMNQAVLITTEPKGIANVEKPKETSQEMN